LVKENSKKLVFKASLYVIIAFVLGIIIDLIQLDNIESSLVLDLQSLFKESFGIQFFSLITYIGDFYLWIVLTIIYLIYTFLKSRKNFSNSVELAVFLVLTTVITYIFKGIFDRPRPYQHSINIIPYVLEDSSSYPSGHVSRAFGALLIVSNRLQVGRYLTYIGIFLLALSRIILGVHYPTDAIGGVFLSLAAWKLSNYVIQLLRVNGLIV
jgi:undecaprenyl-diphosphatase